MRFQVSCIDRSLCQERERELKKRKEKDNIQFGSLYFALSFKIQYGVRPGEDNRLASCQKPLPLFDLSDGCGWYKSLPLHATYISIRMNCRHCKNWHQNLRENKATSIFFPFLRLFLVDSNKTKTLIFIIMPWRLCVTPVCWLLCG